MRLHKIIIYLTFLALIAFVACDEDSGTTEPESSAAQAEISLQMKAMDQMVSEVAGGPMLFAMLQFQAISTDFFPEGFMPLAPQILQNNSLKKLSGFGEFNEVKIDTGMVALFAVLEVLVGTHSYSAEDSSWSHTEQPEDQVIFIYPFQTTTASQEAKIVISNYSLENTKASMDMTILIDNATVLTMAMDVNGNNFIMPFTESTLSSVDIEGIIAGQSGASANYTINITDNSAAISLTAAGLSGLTITAEGSGIISSGLNSDEDPASNIETVTIAVGENIEFVVTDVNADSGKVGEVYYKGDDVGDLVMVDEQIKIEYAGGATVNLQDLMPNTFTYISLIGGIGG